MKAEQLDTMLPWVSIAPFGFPGRQNKTPSLQNQISFKTSFIDSRQDQHCLQLRHEKSRITVKLRAAA